MVVDVNLSIKYLLIFARASGTVREEQKREKKEG
jgi:hypothetical protein